MSAKIPFIEMAERFARCYTGAVSDILDEMGYWNQALPSSIRAIEPGMVVSGPAFTLRGEPSTTVKVDEELLNAALKMLGEIPRGSVIVTQSNDERASHLGELTSTALKAGGCRGAVIDGGCRDIDYILRLGGFPVFCRYTTPADALGRWMWTEAGKPVTIGQVPIRTGDFVFGDRDGVIIVPQEVAEKVLLKVEEVVTVENKVREELIAGASFMEVYKKYGRL